MKSEGERTDDTERRTEREKMKQNRRPAYTPQVVNSEQEVPLRSATVRRQIFVPVFFR